MSDVNETIPGTELQVLPASYVVEFSKEFIDTFCTDPKAAPPQPMRVSIWEATEGRAYWEEQTRIAKEEFQEAKKAYSFQYDRIEKKNERIDALNRKRNDEYRDQVARFEAANRRRSVSRLKWYLRTRLSRLIDSQTPALRALLVEVAERCLRNARQNQAYGWWIILMILYGGIMLPFPLATPLIAIPLVLSWYRAIEIYCEAKTSILAGNVCGRTFYKRREPMAERTPTSFYTPVIFPPSAFTSAKDWYEEAPLRELKEDRERIVATDELIICLVIACVPILSLVLIPYTIWSYVSRVNVTNLTLNSDKLIKNRKKRLLREFDEAVCRPEVEKYLLKSPKKPKWPTLKEEIDSPAAPKLSVVPPPHIPSHLFTEEQKGDYSHTLRGAVVYDAEEVRSLARHSVFADRKVQAYFSFGDLPMPFYERQAPHVLCIGTTGSGKTTTMRMLMSTLLPLTRKRKVDLLESSTELTLRRPSHIHEWSRSFTHQAVVYNAKNENVQFLMALGFDTSSDLIILDPSDPHCFAWDAAKDINDRDSVRQFAELLVPSPTGAGQKNDSWIWELQARRLIEAVIISLRNAALAKSEAPNWTLRDLVNAVETPETLRSVLRYHDRPDAVIAQLVNLADQQASSVYMSATAYISQFQAAAQRWEEASRLGRRISLKQWALTGGNSVLVLPNTQSNVDVNGPLNQVFFKALTNIFLQHEFSVYPDEAGKERVRQRYIFIDEVGQAGRIAELERLMTEGREFGIHVVLGLHQLSQLRETYGNNVAETILGLCPYMALLKTGDTTTAKWMSERIGERLKVYDKYSFTYGTNKGSSWSKSESTGKSSSRGTSEAESTTFNQGTNNSKSFGTHSSTDSYRRSSGGSSSQVTKGENSSIAKGTSKTKSQQESENTSNQTQEGGSEGSNESETKSTELRQEAAILPSEFMSLPDPRTTGVVGGYYIAPSMPIWRADIPISHFAPKVEYPELLTKMPRVVKWEDDEKVSKAIPWNDADYKRLNINLRIPTAAPPEPKIEVKDDRRGEKPLFDDFDFS